MLYKTDSVIILQIFCLTLNIIDYVKKYPEKGCRLIPDMK